MDDGGAKVNRTLLGAQRQRRRYALDLIDTPRKHLLQGRDRHRRQHELRELAHVEATRAGTVRLDVVCQAGEVLCARSRQPRLLEGYTVHAPAWGGVQVTKPVWPEQPFVA